METVLVCVAPEAGYELYELWHQQFHGAGWEAHVLPVTEVGAELLPPVAAAVAQATDWPDEQLPVWLAAIRQAIGPRKRLLALVPRPPASYAAETQALWNHALGYGAKINEVVAVVNDILAGNL
jgi:hypothetical protein